MSQVHPLSKLQAAESTLIAQINAAADRLDQVATDDLHAALDRLRASALNAASRLHGVATAVAAIVGEVLADMGDLTAEIALALDDTVPQPSVKLAVPAPTLDDIAPPQAQAVAGDEPPFEPGLIDHVMTTGEEHDVEPAPRRHPSIGHHEPLSDQVEPRFRVVAATASPNGKHRDDRPKGRKNGHPR